MKDFVMFICQYLQIVDTWLISKCQLATDKIQQWIGITSNVITKFVVWCYFLLYVAYIILRYIRFTSISSTILDVIGCLIVYFFFKTMILNRKMMDIAPEEIQIKLMGTLIFFRFFFLVYYHLNFLGHILEIYRKTPYSEIKATYVIDCIQENLKLLFLYLLACKPRKKKKSDIKKFMEKLSESLTPVPQFAITKTVI